MKTIITGKDMVISNAISERVLKKTAKMERYLDPNTELLVRLTKKKDGRRKCEITVPFEGVTLRAEASSDDNLYVSIDQALAKLDVRSTSTAPSCKAASAATPSRPWSWNTPKSPCPSRKTNPRWFATRPSRFAP